MTDEFGVGAAAGKPLDVVPTRGADWRLPANAVGVANGNRCSGGFGQ
jgi:hypothetical protein